MTTAITLRRPHSLHRPGLLGSGVFDDVFDAFFNDFPTTCANRRQVTLLRISTVNRGATQFLNLLLPVSVATC